jgi:hypothetical protein
MSDERQAFEQLHAIPSGAEWCEKRHIYIHKNYSGLVLHPINESWEAFCEGALWQASREAVESEPSVWVHEKVFKLGLERFEGRTDCPTGIWAVGMVPLYTYPVSTKVPEAWRTTMKELADDLKSEIESRRSGDLNRRIERDLLVVDEARVLLDEQDY